MFMLFNNYLNYSINISQGFKKYFYSLSVCLLFSDLSDDLNDVFVDNEEFDEFL
jgi:hypothetical protein